MMHKLLLAWAFLAIAGKGRRMNLHSTGKGETSESSGQESVAEDNPSKARKAPMALLAALLGQSDAFSVGHGAGLIHRPHTGAVDQGAALNRVYDQVPGDAALNAVAARRNSIVSMQEKGVKASSGRVLMPLSLENVELVLDEMRPYLLADGGNVEVHGIDGGVVQLELQGACSSCPSSEMTLHMGLERGLREKIPEIIKVEQVNAEGDDLTDDGIEAELDAIRPFLKVAGGSVELQSLKARGLQPTVTLKMSGEGSAITSVRGEISMRLRRKFPTLANVEWSRSD